MATIGVRAIKSPKFNPRAIERAILKEKKAKGRDIVKELEKTVRTWAGKPKFSAKVKDRGKDVVIEITLTGAELDVKKWTWLDEGTKKNYPISGSPRLAFINSDPAVGGRAYVSKTAPGKLLSRPSEPATGPLHFPETVIHPGIEARGWTKMIRKMMEDDFGKRIRIVLKRVIEKGK